MTAIHAKMRGEGRPHLHHEDHIEMRVDAIYDPRRPHEARLGFGGAGDYTEWLVSRETLCIGAMWQSPAGMGDFLVLPGGDTTTVLVLRASELDWQGQPVTTDLYINVPRKQLLEFLRQTFTIVPPGTESDHCDLDAGIAALMGRTTP